MTRSSKARTPSPILSRRVTRYETPDGTLHDTLTAARKHQIRRELLAILQYDGQLIARGVDLDATVELLCGNAAELSQLLRRFMQLEQITVSKFPPAKEPLV